MLQSIQKQQLSKLNLHPQEKHDTVTENKVSCWQLWSPIEKEFFFYFTSMISFDALYLKSILHILGTGPNLEAKCLLTGFTLFMFLKVVHMKLTYSTTNTH